MQALSPGPAPGLRITQRSLPANGCNSQFQGLRCRYDWDSRNPARTGPAMDSNSAWPAIPWALPERGGMMSTIRHRREAPCRLQPGLPASAPRPGFLKHACLLVKRDHRSQVKSSTHAWAIETLFFPHPTARSRDLRLTSKLLHQRWATTCTSGLPTIRRKAPLPFDT